MAIGRTRRLQQQTDLIREFAGKCEIQQCDLGDDMHNLPMPLPMHIDTTPKRAALPRRAISCSSVAVARAPTQQQVTAQQYIPKPVHLQAAWQT